MVVLSDGFLGAFELPATYTDANPNRSPRALVLEDVNRDGDLDLVVANGAGSVRVLPIMGRARSLEQPRFIALCLTSRTPSPSAISMATVGQTS